MVGIFQNRSQKYAKSKHLALSPKLREKGIPSALFLHHYHGVVIMTRLHILCIGGQPVRLFKLHELAVHAIRKVLAVLDKGILFQIPSPIPGRIAALTILAQIYTAFLQ